MNMNRFVFWTREDLPEDRNPGSGVGWRRRAEPEIRNSNRRMSPSAFVGDERLTDFRRFLIFRLKREACSVRKYERTRTQREPPPPAQRCATPTATDRGRAPSSCRVLVS